MAEYTYKQWGDEKTEENNIHADDCYRWQAGIEAAGGTWDGEWTDLDTSGKGLITIDQFNALESQIQSKVSSYTPKGYDPDSTVQIVPGPDGWNKVEDGILKAVCEPTGVNRNWLQNTHDLTNDATKLWYSGEYSINTDENGYGIAVLARDNAVNMYMLTTKDATGDAWAGTDFVFSMDLKCDNLTSELSTIFVQQCVCHSSTGASWVRKYYLSNRLNESTYLTFNTDDFKNGEWFRLTAKGRFYPRSEMVEGTSITAALQRYGIQIYLNSMPDTVYIRKPKLELANAATDWVPAMEDYGYGDNTTTLTAAPQSVEDSDEVAAPEAEEIE